MSNRAWAPDPSGDSWFRIGRIDITSTLIAVAIGTLGILVWVIMPVLPQWLFYAPQHLFAGQVWRIVTWPLADSISLWSILNLVLLWYFGRDIEAQIGRRRMAWLLLGAWASLTVATTVIGLILPGAALAGMGMIEFAILLLWIAEWPSRRFLFNVPAWAFGAFLVGLQVLTMLGTRRWSDLLSFIMGMGLVAIVARAAGLLGEYNWLPGRRPQTVGATARAPKVSRAQQRAAQQRVSDDQRMDDLLGKISAQGIHSLTSSERKELDRLRQRRRG
ncbi:rhomboid family intramembrane serine protease [Aestuariimicrobium ganziense]|uniref:rhomboid family intramembrane serine protease n=1 Tax=Aestuariimicrobium ganziense TaxID=2773677 RepID=UPI001944AF47|nr:rhomboid family intramembrane serine protease [Aestuariimicrobium ganziense]